MLAKRYRLRRGVDVQRVRREGRRWRHPLAILVVLPAQRNMIHTDDDVEYEPASESRFAFAASRRVGTAVVRNRAKRLLREAVRLQLNEIEPGWDCLILAREQTAHTSYREVEQAVRRLLLRAGLIAQTPLCDHPS